MLVLMILVRGREGKDYGGGGEIERSKTIVVVR